MKKSFYLFLITVSICANAQQDVFYHVFQRSFFDSNQDGHGDLKGMQQKLDYLQDLGITTILLTPLYASDFYHNYFASDFEAIDPEYGNMEEYTALVKEVHRRKMKIYQDVEMQYVAGTHPWFIDGFGNPQSEFSKYLLYKDKENKEPVWFFNVPEFTIHNGEKQKIIVVNMKEKAVKDYTLKVLSFWIDPNKDGKFDDGVDGFRLDHMMDNLDNANILTNLFSEFWTPLLGSLKKQNPNLKIVAEQANWGSFGHDYFTKGSVDYVFAFRLKFAINNFKKSEIEKVADSTFRHNPLGKNQIVFLENHDTKRFASEPGMSLEKSKAAAAIQLLIGGIPSLYYGQEIGMRGEQKQLGMTDGNDIPVRESFEWYKNENGNGTADWYKNTGPWWDQRNNKSADGISVEEGQGNKESLYNWYRQLLALRKKETLLQTGSYSTVFNENNEVLTFSRSMGTEKIVVFVNLSATAQKTSVALGERAGIFQIFGNGKVKVVSGNVMADLPAFGVAVARLK